MQTYNCAKNCCHIKISEPDQEPKIIKRGRCNKAGVFIYDPDEQRILLVQSRGHLWGPPKGTLEDNENSVQCAMREVKEETGLVVEAEQFTKAIIIKNRAVYYYLELKNEPVHLQNQKNNDANGITWIKLDCLEECIKSGNIVLNQHCNQVLKKFLGKEFTKSDFVKVIRKK